MLRASRQSQAGSQKALAGQPFTIPFPTGGLNATDNFTELKPTEAVTLVNWFPEASYGTFRNGSASWKSTGTGAAVPSLLPWYNPAGTDKLFAGAATALYDVSTSGGTGPSVVTGLTNVFFQWTNFTTPGGSYLVACNGADHVQNFDGTTWTNPSITVATDTTFANVLSFKQRLWFGQINTLNLWYLPTASIAGAATQFPLGAVFRLGGQIMCMGSFSYDAGDGPDDYMAIITSNGEVAVYQGTDPSSVNTFSLTGLFSCGPPIGRRCMVRLNGDLAILTSDGVISMQALLQFDRASDQKAAFTAKIQTLFSQIAQTIGTTGTAANGWSISLYPQARYCIVNYPNTTTNQYQFIMNTVTGAWTQFKGMAANIWATAQGNLYFGGNDGNVYQANTGYTDSGSNINTDLKAAWSLLNAPGKKTVPLIRPLLQAGSGFSYALRINWDFDDTAPANLINPPVNSGAVWGSMIWPWVWAGTSPVLQWRGGGGYGTWAAVRMIAANNGQPVIANGFTLMVNPGVNQSGAIL